MRLPPARITLDTSLNKSGFASMMFPLDWHFDKSRIQDLDQSLGLYDNKEFKSPTRSTVALLSFLKHGGGIFQAVLNRLCQPSSAISAHLEYKVSPPLGSGRASQTDLMLVSTAQAVAIEAKWTEPRYEEVCAWEASQNQSDVLEGWLSLIRRYSSPTLSREDVQPAIYQMVHRAASACSFERSPTLAYLQFMPLPDGKPLQTDLASDMQKLYGIFGSPSRFRFCLITVRLFPTRAFQAIGGLPKDLPETALSVQSALRKDTLFDFAGVDFQEFVPASC
jgi:hypothetical protein